MRRSFGWITGVAAAILVVQGLSAPAPAGAVTLEGHVERLADAEKARGDEAGADFIRRWGAARAQERRSEVLPLPSGAREVNPFLADWYDRLAEKIRRSRHWLGEDLYYRDEIVGADLALARYELAQGAAGDRRLAADLLRSVYRKICRRQFDPIPGTPAPRVEAPPPPTADVEVEPGLVLLGGDAVLSWTTTDATEARLDGLPVTLEGSRTIRPDADREFVLVATGPGGSAEDRDRVEVRAPARPPTADVEVDPDSIRRGEEATLSWRTSDATDARIDGEAVSLHGSRPVRPAEAHEYLLVATGPGGRAEDRDRIEVRAPAPPLVFRIHFDYDRSTIRADAEDTLTALARSMLRSPDLRVRIEGHTDAMGTDAYNQGLSERRAQAALEYLTSRFGIEPDRFLLVGRSEGSPMAPNTTADGADDPAGRALNRRAEFHEVR